MFYISRSRNTGTLVYSAYLVPGEIADDTMNVDKNDESDDNDDVYEEAVENTDDMTARQVFNVAMEMKEELRDAKGIEDCPPYTGDLSFANAVQSIPPTILNYLRWLPMVCVSTHNKDDSSSLQSFVFPSSSIRCFKSVLKQFLGAFLCPVM